MHFEYIDFILFGIFVIAGYAIIKDVIMNKPHEKMDE